jgi:hypothetical protein
MISVKHFEVGQWRSQAGIRRQFSLPFVITISNFAFTDASMLGPELGGRLGFLRSASPSMTVVVISGSAARPESIKLNNAELLHKRLDLTALHRVLAELAPVARDGAPGE